MAPAVLQKREATPSHLREMMRRRDEAENTRVTGGCSAARWCWPIE